MSQVAHTLLTAVYIATLRHDTCGTVVGTSLNMRIRSSYITTYGVQPTRLITQSALMYVRPMLGASSEAF